MRQREQAEEYQGAERDVTFVRKYDDRLWAYCCDRFAQRWEGKTRSIPQGYIYEGEVGWFFPSVWIAEFTDRFGTEIRTKLTRVDFDERATMAQRLAAKIGEAA